MVNNKRYGTDLTWYTIIHRKKGERRGHRIGYRSEDLETLRHIARNELDSGEYAMVKIVNSETNEEIECFTKVHR